ncbi:MAG: L,D-transpeptidase [Clostridia bacterium]|nr:L,D-transpeptidase [Clostridia bacterium]
MKRWICLALLVLFLPLPAGAEQPEIAITLSGDQVIPWQPSLILFTLPEASGADLTLRDEAGEVRFVIALEVQGLAGQNSLYWNGTYNHEAAPMGNWRLCLEAGDLWAETGIVIGAPAPTEIPQGVEAAEPPAVTVEPELLIQEAPEDFQTEDTLLPETEGQEAPLVQQLVNTSAVAVQRFTPATTSPYDGQDLALNYWTLPMDIRQEEAIWQALTAPITVVENGKGEKAQIILRSEPSADSPGVGSITCATQGVHVLQRGEEWSLVECYSSSFHNSPILNWNALVQGYVRTKYLREIIPSQEMGLVVDKLAQRLYIFKEGHLFSTLLVSTGLANARQPYNETRSGEFLLTSKVGTFRSDNLLCGMAIRFNKGDLLHEVPHTVNGNGVSNYSVAEAKLGSKASHGCIRVQRRKTPEGVNMAWLWANLKKNSQTRLFIWEDWQGRQLEIPAADTLLYYYPEGGQYYHSQATCSSLQEGITLEPFCYGQLEEEEYAHLSRCEYCAPVLRQAEIEERNAAYAFGGDHDPVLTEALAKCPRPLRK